ncbi:hypothetical protein C7S20_19405 [Christiangramia fulva]|uniref:Uncharacterized protein n=1 Tax=Christiangramia fulva TaxID=2126553 RepID=A0A2R3ZAA6_9FLAO|nr:hypothetical protein [Christiangramia fulva]AVR47243.1 hypothetical protein C7S20_19405 [Christiangramia fulva]
MSEKSIKILVVGMGPGDGAYHRAAQRLAASGFPMDDIILEPATLPIPEPKPNTTLFIDECLPFSKEKFDQLQPERSKYHK